MALFEYVADWRPDDGGEARPTQFVGRYDCQRAADGEVTGHYVKPLLVRIRDEWLVFAHPPTPRRYFQYPHLLELAPELIGPGHVVAGLWSGARAVDVAPRATKRYVTQHNIQWHELARRDDTK